MGRLTVMMTGAVARGITPSELQRTDIVSENEYIFFPSGLLPGGMFGFTSNAPFLNDCD